MVKKFTLAILILFVFTGCAREYEANMQARKEIAWTQTTNQRMAVQDIMEVVNRILNPFEEEYKRQIELKPEVVVIGGSYKKPSGDNYAMFLCAETMGKMIEQQGKADIMRARAQAIQYMIPIIEGIYAQNLMDFGTPMSTNDVLGKLVAQVPFLATVGGMYALGAKGIDAAGDTISAVDSVVNNGGVQASEGATAVGGDYSGSDMAGNDITTTTDTVSDIEEVIEEVEILPIEE